MSDSTSDEVIITILESKGGIAFTDEQKNDPIFVSKVKQIFLKELQDEINREVIRTINFNAREGGDTR